MSVASVYDSNGLLVVL